MPFRFFMTCSVIVLFPVVLAVGEGRAEPWVRFSVAGKPSIVSRPAEMFLLLFPSRRQSEGERWPHCSLTWGPLRASVFSSIKWDQISRPMKTIKKPWASGHCVNANQPASECYLRGEEPCPAMLYDVIAVVF